MLLGTQKRVQECDKKVSTYSLFPIYKKVLKTIMFLIISDKINILRLPTTINTHKIYEPFDCSPMRDINGIFLDISNVFVNI